MHRVDALLTHKSRRDERVLSAWFLAASMAFFMGLTLWCFWVIFSAGQDYSCEQKQTAHDLGKYALAYLAGAGTPQFVKTLVRQ
jgi:hypothetical protein